MFVWVLFVVHAHCTPWPFFVLLLAMCVCVCARSASSTLLAFSSCSLCVSCLAGFDQAGSLTRCQTTRVRNQNKPFECLVFGCRKSLWCALTFWFVCFCMLLSRMVIYFWMISEFLLRIHLKRQHEQNTWGMQEICYFVCIFGSSVWVSDLCSHPSPTRTYLHPCSYVSPGPLFMNVMKFSVTYVSLCFRGLP